MSRLNASWAGLAFKVVWNVVLMAHITGMRSSCWADTVSRSWSGDWNGGDFWLLDGCVQVYRWLEGFWQWSVWIKFHMIEEVLEIWWRRILSHCHVNNQPVGGSNRARLDQGSKRRWCFPCFSMLQFPWSVYSSQ
jgi:hypothetical protein